MTAQHTGFWTELVGFRVTAQPEIGGMSQIDVFELQHVAVEGARLAEKCGAWRSVRLEKVTRECYEGDVMREAAEEIEFREPA